MSNWGWSTGTSGYDDEDRLVSWTRDDNNLSQSWALTNEGDWSQFTENTNTENRTHGPAHELTAVGSTALGYDPKGNLTVDNTKSHSYTWDFDNRMSAADTDGDNTDDVTLKYDALGRRIAKTAGTNAVVYVSLTQPIQYSPFAGQVVAEYSSGAAPSSPTERYVYASYIDEPVLKDGTGGTVYYHRNSQYSVAALTSASGAVVERYGYEPYGELTILAADGSTVRASSSYGNSYTYTGRRWDAELKLYYFRARYYDPGLGRFVGRDPLGGPGGTNSYVYCGSMPMIYLDANGKDPQEPKEPTIVRPKPKIIPVPRDFPDRPLVPTARPPCQDRNTSPTKVRVCKRRLRKPVVGGLGGHIYIRVNCGGGATEEWAWSAGPLEPSEKCKGKCGRKQQLRTAYFKFLPKQPDGPPTSPEYPEEGETHACTVLTIDKSPAEISNCLFKVAKANAECCVPYQGIPRLPGEGCNSNCMAYWMASACFQPVLKGDLGLPKGIPVVATPGWGKKMPQCVSDALRKAGVVR